MTEHTTNPSTNETPYGYCHCGCGQQTSIAEKTYASRGVIKGQPYRFIRGHGERCASAEIRFWKYVTPGDPNECWPWQGTARDDGYGQLTVDGRIGKTVRAHRFSWELHFGPIPQGMDVCHKCDNPPCCNPYHFFLGTDADNMADKVAKGRARGGAPGETNPNHKLTRQDILKIRELGAQGVSPTEIGRQFDITDATAGKIVQRKSWKHIP